MFGFQLTNFINDTKQESIAEQAVLAERIFFFFMGANQKWIVLTNMALMKQENTAKGEVGMTKPEEIITDELGKGVDKGKRGND